MIIYNNCVQKMLIIGKKGKVVNQIKTIYRCFSGSRHKVLTMSYDDGMQADRRLVEIFNKYGIKGAFHILTDAYRWIYWYDMIQFVLKF